jgi:deoxyribodipyrimidine photo-lyase
VTKSLVWLRRDLRLHDHASLSYATNNHDQVYVVFVFDTVILDKLKNKQDSRVEFIYQQLMGIKEKLQKTGGDLLVLHGDPTEIIPELASNLKVDEVVTNRDYEVYASKRDKKVAKKLADKNIEFKDFKDTVVFEADEVLTGARSYFKVFTPYKNKWLETLEQRPDQMLDKKVKLAKIVKTQVKFEIVKSLKDIGFISVDEKFKSASSILNGFLKKVKSYDEQRDFPSIEGTSRLSVHLRFGTVSVRQLLRAVYPGQTKGEKVWISELIWREFYFALLDKNPNIEKHAYQPKYENIPWQNDKKLFKAWCEGKTGVPIVDAGMRQLNETGWMHNRLRMITASYLVKTLLIDWRWGEKYFAEKLIDFDLSANNGGWQWSASTGCDAAPYFRVFNPYRQSERFDKNGEFIKHYCPELKGVSGKFIHQPFEMKAEMQQACECVIGKDYPAPIADYKKNRVLVINMFKEASDANA